MRCLVGSDPSCTRTARFSWFVGMTPVTVGAVTICSAPDHVGVVAVRVTIRRAWREVIVVVAVMRRGAMVRGVRLIVLLATRRHV